MEKKVDLQCNKIVHLEKSMVMYGVCNSETLEELINTVDKMHNTTTWNEKKYLPVNLSEWYNWYLSKNSISNYAINSLLYLRPTKENIFICMEHSSANYVCMKRQ